MTARVDEFWSDPDHLFGWTVTYPDGGGVPVFRAIHDGDVVEERPARPEEIIDAAPAPSARDVYLAKLAELGGSLSMAKMNAAFLAALDAIEAR